MNQQCLHDQLGHIYLVTVELGRASGSYSGRPLLLRNFSLSSSASSSLLVISTSGSASSPSSPAEPQVDPASPVTMHPTSKDFNQRIQTHKGMHTGKE